MALCLLFYVKIKFVTGSFFKNFLAELEKNNGRSKGPDNHNITEPRFSYVQDRPVGCLRLRPYGSTCQIRANLRVD